MRGWSSQGDGTGKGAKWLSRQWVPLYPESRHRSMSVSVELRSAGLSHFFYPTTTTGCRVSCLLARKMRMQISTRVPGLGERLEFYLKIVMALHVSDAVSHSLGSWKVCASQASGVLSRGACSPSCRCQASLPASEQRRGRSALSSSLLPRERRRSRRDASGRRECRGLQAGVGCGVSSMNVVISSRKKQALELDTRGTSPPSKNCRRVVSSSSGGRRRCW